MSCDHESWCDRKPYVCSITENFFQNRRTFEKFFIVDGSHGPSHFSCVGFQSKFFENPTKKKFLDVKNGFSQKFEKSFHEMFLMITAITKTFDESNVSNRVPIYCFDVYLCVSWREMRQNCKNHWTTAKINFSQLSELKYK